MDLSLLLSTPKCAREWACFSVMHLSIAAYLYNGQYAAQMCALLTLLPAMHTSIRMLRKSRTDAQIRKLLLFYWSCKGFFMCIDTSLGTVAGYYVIQTMPLLALLVHIYTTEEQLEKGGLRQREAQKTPYHQELSEKDTWDEVLSTSSKRTVLDSVRILSEDIVPPSLCDSELTLRQYFAEESFAELPRSTRFDPSMGDFQKTKDAKEPSRTVLHEVVLEFVVPERTAIHMRAGDGRKHIVKVLNTLTSTVMFALKAEPHFQIDAAPSYGVIPPFHSFLIQIDSSSKQPFTGRMAIDVALMKNSISHFDFNIFKETDRIAYPIDIEYVL